MKSLLLALLLIPYTYAQPTTTHIHDTVYDTSARPYSGDVEITLNAPSATSGGLPILRVVTRKTIPASGVIDVYLIPNDTALPTGTSYVFAFGNGDKKTCIFPTTSGSVTLENYCTDTAPGTPAPQIPLSWLTVSGYSNGTYCVLVINGVASLSTTSCPGSGGSGGALSWSALTSSQWLNLTSAQWLALTN